MTPEERDIVERLSEKAQFLYRDGTWVPGAFSDPECKEAADEILRLRTALAASEAKLEKAREALTFYAEAPWPELEDDFTFADDNTALHGTRARATLKEIAAAEKP